MKGTHLRMGRRVMDVCCACQFRHHDLLTIFISASLSKGRVQQALTTSFPIALPFLRVCYFYLLIVWCAWVYPWEHWFEHCLGHGDIFILCYVTLCSYKPYPSPNMVILSNIFSDVHSLFKSISVRYKYYWQNLMNKIMNFCIWIVTIFCNVTPYSQSDYYSLSPWFLARLIIRSWRWRRYIPLKRRLTYKELYDLIIQKIVVFITTVLKTSNPKTLVYI
jgi:hypothetical protein